MTLKTLEAQITTDVLPTNEAELGLIWSKQRRHHAALSWRLATTKKRSRLALEWSGTGQRSPPFTDEKVFFAPQLMSRENLIPRKVYCCKG